MDDVRRCGHRERRGAVVVRPIEGEAPYISCRGDGADQRIDARFVAGCDGSDSPSRKAIPASVAREFERVYPFGWLGILADVPPYNHELIFVNHERGFALISMRSETRSRYYIDVPLTERVEDWSDDRVWDELAIRLGPEAAANITREASIEKSIASLRSYVLDPMPRISCRQPGPKGSTLRRRTCSMPAKRWCGFSARLTTTPSPAIRRGHWRGCGNRSGAVGR